MSELELSDRDKEMRKSLLVLLDSHKDCISKQVVRDKIKELESYRNKYFNEELENQISMLKELLGENDD